MNPTKVIFLDVDGVLNSYSAVKKEYKRTGRKGGLLGTYDEHLDRLEKIVKATDAKIVLSSTWRVFFPPNHPHVIRHITDKFNKRDMSIYSVTPEFGERGLEIQAWIDKTNFTGRYVVIDDETFDILLHISADYVVKTSMEYGLLDEHVERAIEILNRP